MGITAIALSGLTVSWQTVQAAIEQLAERFPVFPVIGLNILSQMMLIYVSYLIDCCFKWMQQ
jgi:hypothetical protein